MNSASAKQINMNHHTNTNAIHIGHFVTIQPGRRTAVLASSSETWRSAHTCERLTGRNSTGSQLVHRWGPSSVRLLSRFTAEWFPPRCGNNLDLTSLQIKIRLLRGLSKETRLFSVYLMTLKQLRVMGRRCDHGKRDMRVQHELQIVMEKIL